MRAFYVILGLSVLGLAPMGAVALSDAFSNDPWCQVIDERLVRTNADEYSVNSAVEEVLNQHRLISEESAEFEDVTVLEVCEFEQHLDAWFFGDNIEQPAEEVARRLVREQLDADGQKLRIEQITHADSNVMIYIEHETPNGESEIAESVAKALLQKGVEVY